MLKRLVHVIARRHHPWRNMEFDELAEIYASMSLRSFGLGVIGIFVPIYLYTSGVALQDIFLFFVAFFLGRVVLSFIAAFVVGRIGPKHSIAVATVITIIFLFMLLSFGSIRWPLSLMALVFTAANGLFFVAYNTDFSKIKDKNHAGKELGWVIVFEQLGHALGPVVGGLLAAIFAPEVTLAVAIAVLLGSLIPLFLTKEPVKVHQHVTFKGFKISKYKRDFVATAALGVQTNAIVAMWPLLMGVFIFTEGTYAKLGFLIGLSMLVSVFSTRMFGRFIDSSKGGQLLRWGVIMNIVLFVSKSLVTSAGGAIAVSTLGQPIYLAYKMPLIKGVYDSADDSEKYRIVYIAYKEAFSGLAKAAFSIAIFAASYVFDPIAVLRASLAVVPLIGLLMLSEKFPALKRV